MANVESKKTARGFSISSRKEHELKDKAGSKWPQLSPGHQHA